MTAMNGAIPPSIFMEAILIMAWRCLVFLAPLLAIAALAWLAFRTDRIINRLFPDLQWEKSLGWLNIRAERRANTALRWLGYAIYVQLGAALYGIAWAAVGLQDWDRAAVDPAAAFDLMLRIPVLCLGLGAWLLYLGSWLIPKLRSEREEAGLKRFRVQMEELEQEREGSPRSRVNSPLRKPRTNEPFEPPKAPASFGAGRGRNWRQPGG
jgi:hypothetical protein